MLHGSDQPPDGWVPPARGDTRADSGPPSLKEIVSRGLISTTAACSDGTQNTGGGKIEVALREPQQSIIIIQ